MKRDQGQIAVGLAFAFTMILAMFGLVFNSALIVREKMKLQQSTDFGAKAAAQLQRVGLNEIRNLNETTEEFFFSTEAALNIPFCQKEIMVWSNEVKWVTGKVGAIIQEPVLFCEDACEKYENFRRNQYIKAYETFQRIQKEKIEWFLLHTNEKAHEAALKNILQINNLPFRLHKLLVQKYGSSTPVQSLIEKYNNGDFKEYLEVQDFEKVPLFFADEEPRLFVFQKYHYQTIYTGYYPKSCYGPIPSVPGEKLTSVKIVKKPSKEAPFTTSFLVATRYSPPPSSIDQILNLWVRERDLKKHSPIHKDSQGEESLFKTRNVMGALSLAKPYGGSFPSAGNLLNPLDFGSLGKVFTGSKLIGIADYKKELEGNRTNLSFDTPSGASYETEDFLH